MLKYAVAMVCGLSLTGNVYMAGWGTAHMHGEEMGDCCTPPSRAQMMEVSAMAAGDDMKNTMCIVMAEHVGAGKDFVSFKGKLYHICCSDCVTSFNKDPEKYVKALEADPAKFGIKK
jgi:hypothetical protein